VVRAVEKVVQERPRAPNGRHRLIRRVNMALASMVVLLAARLAGLNVWAVLGLWALFAAFKEFWYDVTFDESHGYKRAWADFFFYQLGGVAGCLVGAWVQK
jgi:hypothetical protein